MEFMDFVKAGAGVWLGWVLMPFVAFAAIALFAFGAYAVAFVLATVLEVLRKIGVRK